MAIFGIYISFLGYTLHLLGLLSIFFWVFFLLLQNLPKHHLRSGFFNVGWSLTCDFCEDLVVCYLDVMDGSDRQVMEENQGFQSEVSFPDRQHFGP